MHWYEVENVDSVDSPSLLLYPDRIERNIDRMIAMAGDAGRLWPHAKTHKMAEVIGLQQAAGITKFKCATIAEAEMIARCGAEAVLLAHQPVGPKIARLLELARTYPATRFLTIVDDRSALGQLSQAAGAAGVTLEVLVDLDCGMGRSGIRPGPEALELYRMLHDLPGIEPGGLHAYDGQVRASDLAERTAQCDAAFAPIERFAQEVREQGLSVRRVIAGGTPSFPVHAQHADRDLSPGTCVLWDAGYGGKYEDLAFLPAALVLSRVVSKPSEQRLCLDLGYKAVSPDAAEPRVVWLDLPDARLVMHSEEHLLIESPQAAQYTVGDVLYGVPLHICPTVALHAEGVVVRDRQAGARWAVVARNRKITI